MDPNYFRSLEQAAVQFIRACETIYNSSAIESGDQLDVLPSPDCPSSPTPDCPSLGLVPLLLKQESKDAPLELSQQDSQSPELDDIKAQNAATDALSLLSACTSDRTSEWIAVPGNNRMSYSREFKLMVIDYYQRNGQNKYRTCKEFHITKSMLKGWLSRIDKIRESRPGSLKSGRTGRRPDIEKQLFSIYCKRLETGLKVSNRWLRERARELAGDVNAVCQFSDRWLRNFKKRFHIDLQRGNLECSHTNPDEPMCSERHAFSDTDSFNDPTELDIGIRNEVVAEIVNQTEQLPIQAFYEKFPLLCKRDAPVGGGRRGRKAQFPDVERVLYDRFIERQKSGERISNRWLQDQARDLAAKLYAGTEEAVKSSRCLFSDRWLANFKKRYGISLKNKSLKQEAEDDATALEEQPPASPEGIDVNTVLTAWLMNQTDIAPLSSPGNSST